MREWLVGGAVAYSILIAFCAFGIQALPASTQEAMRPYAWLLGPPVNLVYGMNYLWPFAIGTIVVAWLVRVITRTESPAMRIVSSAALLIAWAIFGLVAYAPGA
jgi:hypothetical protein